MLIRLFPIFTFFFVTGILGFIGFRIYSEKFASDQIPNNVKIYLITDSVRYKADDVYWSARESIEQGNWRNVYLAIHHLDKLIASTGYDDAKIYRTALQGSVLLMKGNYIKALNCHLEALDFVKDKKYFAHMLYGYRELIKICKILNRPEEAKKYEHDQKVLLFQMQVPPLETIRLKDSVERCRHENPYMAAIAAKELFYTSRNRGDLQGMGKAYMTLGYILDSYKPEALQNYKKALAIYTHLKFYEGIAESCLDMGMVYYQNELYHLALNYFNTALQLSKDEDNKKFQAIAYQDIGLVYRDDDELSDYNLALSNLHKALELAKNNNYTKVMASSSNSLGIVYEYKKDYNQAIYYYNQAIKISEKHGYKRILADAYNNIAEIHKEVYKDYNEAIHYYLKALAIDKETGNEAGAEKTWYNLGITKLKLDEFEKAISYLTKAKNIAEKLNHKKDLELITKELAKAYQHLGNTSEASLYSRQSNELHESNELEELKYLLKKHEQRSKLLKQEAGFRLLRQEKKLRKQFKPPVWEARRLKSIT